MGTRSYLLACSLAWNPLQRAQLSSLLPWTGAWVAPGNKRIQRRAGSEGWGIQLSSPSFIGLMALYPHSNSACLQMKRQALELEPGPPFSTLILLVRKQP